MNYPKNIENRELAQIKELQEKLIQIGYKDEKLCAGTTILVDHHIGHINVNSDQVQILPIVDALKQIPWVQDYMFALIDPEENETVKNMADLSIPPLGYFVNVLPGAKVTLPLQLFTILKTPQARQLIHNLMFIGDYASVDVLSGSVVPEFLKTGKHLSVSETYIGKNANYRSISVESWGSKMQVNNISATKLDENARELEISIMVSDIEEHISQSTLYLGNNAVSSDSSIIFAPKGTHRVMNTDIILEGEGAHAEHITRMVSDGGVIVNNNKILGRGKNSRGYLGCDGLMLKEYGEISSTPQVRALRNDIYLSHEASVGLIASEKIDYLMASGMDEDQARDLIVQGFLEIDKQSIPSSLQEMVKNMVATAKTGSM